MKFCFIGSGTDTEQAPLPGIEISSVAALMREHYDTMVFGGSQIGIMGDFGRAFLELGGSVISATLHADGIAHKNVHNIRCTNLANRKDVLFHSIDALLCYPGGVGTLDELFDFLARCSKKEIVVPRRIFLYNWTNYYSPLLAQFDNGRRTGLISESSMAALRVFQSSDSLRSLLGIRLHQ